MKDMLEVASIERLNPVCFERFEPEDVSYHIIDRFLSTCINKNIII